MFVLAGDGSWDEGTKLVPRNGIASGDQFGRSVVLSGDRHIWKLPGNYRDFIVVMVF